MENLTNVSPGETILLRAYGSVELVAPDEIILCFSGGQNSVLVKLSSGRELLLPKNSLKHLQELLTGDEFYRCHAKYLINLNCVRRYIPKSGELELNNGSIVFVAKSRRAEFRKRVPQLFLGGEGVNHEHYSIW